MDQSQQDASRRGVHEETDGVDTVDPGLDLVGEDEKPPGAERQINPLAGLMDASTNPIDTPAGDTQAPPPPG